MRHFLSGMFSSEEVNPVQLVGVLFAVKEARVVLRSEECLGGLWLRSHDSLFYEVRQDLLEDLEFLFVLQFNFY
jgi:hypothetical protein